MKKEIIKPFDLEAYKNGAKIKTRDGHEVRIVYIDTKDWHLPILTLIKEDDGNKRAEWYTSEGRAYFNEGTNALDLVIVEEVEEAEFWSEDVNSLIGGYYICDDSEILPTRHQPNNICNYNVFATKKQAKSALAMAMISQIMANDVEHFGGVITNEEWEDSIQKYAIYRNGNNISVMITNFEYHFLAFHTKEQRDLFLEKYRDLVSDYLMID